MAHENSAPKKLKLQEGILLGTLKDFLGLYPSHYEIPLLLGEELMKHVKEVHAASGLTLEDLKPHLPKEPFDRMVLCFNRIEEFELDKHVMYVGAKFYKDDKKILDLETFEPLQSRLEDSKPSTLDGKLIWGQFAPDLAKDWKKRSILYVDTGGSSEVEETLLEDETEPSVDYSL